MIKHPFYLAYGVLVLGLVGLAEYRGWSLLSVNEVKDVPKSVRDNPGAYRSHYVFFPRVFRGK
jgi:hypothetical protein